jgi:hypothetical protein
MGIVLNGFKLSRLYHIHWNYLPGIVVNATYIGNVARHFMFNTPAAYHTTLCSTEQYIIPLHVQHIRECDTTLCWTHLQYISLFMLSISAGCDNQFMFNILADTHCAEHICHISYQFVLIISAVYYTISCPTHQQHSCW